MALTMCYLNLKTINKFGKYVIFPRIDQKTCLKTIFTANLIPIIIETKIENDVLVTNIEKIREILENKKNKNEINEILCISSTTSCFAPRAYDDIIEISKLCKDYGVEHIINSAYGIYCTKITDLLNQSNSKGKVSYIVSSTDKNLMVPIGGSFVYSNNKKMINSLAESYPGRASNSTVIDVFVTLLEMGIKSYKDLINKRILLFKSTFDDFKKIAFSFGERMLETTKFNKISLAMTLSNICKSLGDKEITFLGSMFYNRQISGIKVLTKNKKDLCGIKFNNYSSHNDENCNLPLIVFAIAIGIEEKEIEIFKVKFIEIIKEFMKINKISDII